MPIFPPPNSAARARRNLDPATAGFTLIEMLVVLTIIGLVAAVGASLMTQRPSYVARAQVAGRVRAAIAATIQAARQQGHGVGLDVARIVTPVGSLALQSAIGDTQTLTCFPDGSTSGGTVALAGRPLIMVDWLTGAVTDGT